MTAATMFFETVSVGLNEVDLQQDAFESINRTLHDMGQPLTSIALALELLAHEEDEAVSRQMLHAARVECERLMRDLTELRQQTGSLLLLMNKMKEEQA